MFDYLFINSDKNPKAPANSCCANCENAEIGTDAYMMVSGEPMCDGCIDAICCSCEACEAIVMSDDCAHGERGEFTCYDCAHQEA